MQSRPHWWALQSTSLRSSLHVLVTIVVIWQTQIWPWLDWLWLRLWLTLHSFTGARAESWWRQRCWTGKIIHHSLCRSFTPFSWQKDTWIFSLKICRVELQFFQKKLMFLAALLHLWLRWIITCNLNLSLFRASSKSWLLTSLPPSHTLTTQAESSAAMWGHGVREEWGVREGPGDNYINCQRCWPEPEPSWAPHQGNGQSHRSRSREGGGDCQLLPAEPGPTPSLGHNPPRPGPRPSYTGVISQC